MQWEPTCFKVPNRPITRCQIHVRPLMRASRCSPPNQVSNSSKFCLMSNDAFQPIASVIKRKESIRLRSLEPLNGGVQCDSRETQTIVMLHVAMEAPVVDLHPR